MNSVPELVFSALARGGIYAVVGVWFCLGVLFTSLLIGEISLFRRMQYLTAAGRSFAYLAWIILVLAPMGYVSLFVRILQVGGGGFPGVIAFATGLSIFSLLIFRRLAKLGRPVTIGPRQVQTEYGRLLRSRRRR